MLSINFLAFCTSFCTTFVYILYFELCDFICATILSFSLCAIISLPLSFSLLFYFPFQLSSMRRIINEHIFAALHAETWTSASLHFFFLFSLSFTFFLLFLLSLSIALCYSFSNYAPPITCYVTSADHRDH